MANDNLMFPQRFIGYGAYNLCFDRKLGKSSSTGKNFFEDISGRWPAINLVKVICFRQATLEGLPEVKYDEHGVPTGRTQPLFKKNGTINPGFLDNLLALVQQATKVGMWVQVCIFHEQAVKSGSDPNYFETPENCPKILDPRDPGMGTNNCQRLTNFFNVGNTERLNRQLSIAYQIASKLKSETKVLFEIANEVRVQGCSAEGNKTGNCKILPWLNRVAEKISSAVSWDQAPVGTSTGTTNEAVTFARRRPFDGCAEPPLQAMFQDFHAGQWKASDDPLVYKPGIEKAKQRAINYLNLPKDSPNVRLIINDDGLNWHEETPADMKRNAAKIKKWATYAFQKGLSYASKQQYPPHLELDEFALDALQQANDQNPVPK